jgi:Kef-type K+ transport system membrane component KefB
MPTADTLLHLAIALAAVVVAGRLLARGLAWLGQPQVIGEVLAGICLGPSLLGRAAPEVSAFLLPESIAPALGVTAQTGIVLYMLLVGLDLRAQMLRDRLRQAAAAAQGSIAVPFVLGAALSIYLHPTLAAGGASRASFALFMGVAMSITAFPVLARILADRNLSHTPLGVTALTCAALSDVAACVLLAAMALVTQSTVGGALLSGLLDGGVAVHASLAAFLVGVFIPSDSRFAFVLRRSLFGIVTIVLLPAFFAFTGLRTEIGLVSGGAALALTALIIVVATVGKFGGTLAAARLAGMPWRDAASLGILMNARGLMELIVLNIGLDLGVISPMLFTMMVLMALVTTIATAPVLQWLHPALQSLPPVGWGRGSALPGGSSPEGLLHIRSLTTSNRQFDHSTRRRRE